MKAKTRSLLPNLPKHFKANKKGFALVIALGMMSFIVLLILSLTTLTKVETKVADNTAATQKAREYARMALFKAMGELQRHAGKDQVATARADIVLQEGIPITGIKPPAHETKSHWTGVFDSALALSDGSPNDKFGEAVWLVSGKGKDDSTPGSDPQILTTTDYNKTTGHDITEEIVWDKSKPDYFVSGGIADGLPKNVMLVSSKYDIANQQNSDREESGDGDKDTIDHNAVYVELENIEEEDPEDQAKTLVGRFGYWVGDEGIKAKINTFDPDKDDQESNISVAQGSGAGAISGFDNFHKVEDKDLEKIFTPDMLKLTDFSDGDSREKSEIIEEVFHDITTSSMGVISDARHGGLRKDLTAAFENDDDFSEHLDTYGDKDRLNAYGQEITEPDRMFDPVNDSGTETKVDPWNQSPSTSAGNPGGPFWEQLRSFYKLGEEVGENGDSVLVRGQTDKQIGVHPVITMFQCFYVPTFAERTNPLTGSVSYDIHYNILPAVVLWNPYDVTLESEDYTVVFGRNRRANSDEDPSRDAVTTQFQDVYTITPGQDANNETATTLRVPWAFRNWMSFIIKKQSFEPGEAIIFTPAEHQDVEEDPLMILEPGFRLGISFYSDEWTVDDRSAIVPDPETITTKSRDTKMSIQLRNSRRGFLMLYRGAFQIEGIGGTHTKIYDENGSDVTEDDANNGELLIYMKRLATQLASQLQISPIIFDKDDKTNPLDVVFGDSKEMFGRKYIMRLPYNNFQDPSEDLYLPGRSDGGGESGQKTKKTRFLANYNPRSPTIGRRPLEFLEDPSGYFNAAVFMSDQLDDSVQDPFEVLQIPFDGDNGFIGYSEEEEDNSVSNAIFFEIPKGKNHFLSIGQFMHANLTIGHGLEANDPHFNDAYEKIADEFHSLEDFWCDSNRPAYAIGNSLADPQIPSNFIAYREVIDSRNLSSEEQDYEGVSYDVSYLLNDTLWDRYFLSTATDPNKTGNQWDPLPNSRLIPYDSKDDNETLTKDDLTDYHTAAASLMIDGAFNVNSTSVEAWKALLASFFGIDIPKGGGRGGRSDLDRNPASKKESPFVRISNPHGDMIDEDDDATTENSYNGYRALTLEEIEVLATNIVAQVKLRGPFYSLAQFVNRSVDLDKGEDSASDLNKQMNMRLKGALQAAIDMEEGPEQDGVLQPADPEDELQVSFINERYYEDEQMIEVDDMDEAFPFPEAAAGPIAQGVPGFLTQADLLARLGPIFTTRSDTFIIRSYAEVRNPTTGEIDSKAYCEGLVQRLPDFVEPDKDDPEENIAKLNSGVNATFGRKFKLVNFRFLSEDEL